MKRLSYILGVILLLPIIFMLAAMLRNTEQPQNNKLIALTLDDGPSDTSAWFLNELKARNAHVTFFYCGDKVEKYAAVVERAAADGNQIGNHSWDHASLPTLDKEAFDNEVNHTDAVLTEATGVDHFLLRPPYGDISLNMTAWAKRPLIKWSVDTYDWAIHSESDLTDRILRNAKDGAIILMHETVPTTAPGAIKAIDILQKQGYRFVTVDELFKSKGIHLIDGFVYYDAPGTRSNGRLLSPAADPFAYDESKLTAYWAYPYIAYTEDHKLMDGIDDTRFGPEYPMTRAMLITVLARMSGENWGDDTNPFQDVPNNAWYTKSVAWAAANHIVYGGDDGAFCPDDYITKQDACVMMLRYADYKGIRFPSDGGLPYADAALIDDWAKDAVAALTKATIVNGRPSHLGIAFDPQKYATRAEIAAIITRYALLSENTASTETKTAVEN